VRQVVDRLTDEQLGERTGPLVGPGWPDEGERFAVEECPAVVLDEEWLHRPYSERVRRPRGSTLGTMTGVRWAKVHSAGVARPVATSSQEGAERWVHLPSVAACAGWICC
jgi:hypothetical protein